MQPTPTISARQLWGQINTRTTDTGTREWCTPVILPTGGMLVLAENITTRLTARATYLLPCNSDESLISPDTTGNSTVLGFGEPFYASISPQIFALATATVISYVLVILIFITPRTFYVGGPGGGGGFLSRHGLSTSTSVVGIGRRPLLQKVATLGVATSLTIAAADTFHVAQKQYYQGYLDSSALVDDVVNTTLIRVVRIISDSFIWLAQVQTLIRLFPRHKEKVTIKWLGFAMVSADVIFSILDSFVSDNYGTRPRSFQDAIPALNYLFELAISLIYASCVIYYSLSKRRFAFWHPKMKNICLVALMSLMSVLIPVVFFVLDISLEGVAGWGEYIRWVGAAAASVVVWEWVERIEALERDERKDGILGREIFDGDEMLGRPSSSDSDWHGRGIGGEGSGDLEKSAGFMQQIKHVRAKLPIRRRRKRPLRHDGGDIHVPSSGGTGTTTGMPLVPPQPAVSPPSRSDTASAASTVYAIRYHNLTSPSPAAPEPVIELPEPQDTAPKDISDSSTEDPPMLKDDDLTGAQQTSKTQQFWSTVPNPFKRRRAEPPAEVAGAQIASGLRRSPIDATLNLRDRLGAFATAQRDRFGRNGSGPTPPLPVMVIPAPRGRTWSPDEVRNSSSISSAGQTQTQTQTEYAGSSGRVRPAPFKEVAGGADENVVYIPAPTRGPSHGSQSQTPTQEHPHGRDWRSLSSPRSPQSQSRISQNAARSPGQQPPQPQTEDPITRDALGIENPRRSSLQRSSIQATKTPPAVRSQQAEAGSPGVPRQTSCGSSGRLMPQAVPLASQTDTRDFSTWDDGVSASSESQHPDEPDQVRSTSGAGATAIPDTSHHEQQAQPRPASQQVSRAGSSRDIVSSQEQQEQGAASDITRKDV